MIELHNRELAQNDRNIKFSDDYIKPQGIVGKYVIHLRIGLGMGITAAEDDIPEERETTEAIDVIVNRSTGTVAYMRPQTFDLRSTSIQNREY